MPDKLVIITSDDWYFLSHRIPVGEAARSIKLETMVVTGPGERGNDVWDLGYRHIVLPELSRQRKGIFARFGAVHEVGQLLIKEKPKIIFAVSLRYGVLAKLASRIYCKSPCIILMPGLGFLYTSDRLLVRGFLPILNFIMRAIFNDGLTDIVVQNQDNMLFFRQHIGINIDRLHLIRGSGVTLNSFDDCVLPSGKPVIVLAGRMLWSKGIRQFVEAALILKRQGVQVRMVLVGVPDAANPDHVSVEKLSAWAKAGDIEWWGFCDKMSDVWKATSIAVFPTWYGEGIPKALLEAGSFARPVIATDAAGCREVIFNEKTGLLIRPKSAEAIAEAILTYLENPALAETTRLALYRSIENAFDVGAIVRDTAELLKRVQSRRPADG